MTAATITNYRTYGAVLDDGANQTLCPDWRSAVEEAVRRGLPWRLAPAPSCGGERAAASTSPITPGAAAT